MFERRSSGFASHNPGNGLDPVKETCLPYVIHDSRNVLNERFIPVTQMLPRNPLHLLHRYLSIAFKCIPGTLCFCNSQNKLFFCCTRNLPRKAVDFRLMPGISCGCPVVIERLNQQILYQYPADHQYLLKHL